MDEASRAVFEPGSASPISPTGEECPAKFDVEVYPPIGILRIAPHYIKWWRLSPGTQEP